MEKNNPLSPKENEVFDLLNSRIENQEDRKLAFTVMLCCIDNDELCDNIISFTNSRKNVTVTEINKSLSEFLEPMEIVD